MSRKTTTSVYDLARQTGFSTATISRALNNRGRVSEATRQAVFAAMQKANYRPQVTPRRTTIAIVTDRARQVFFGGYVSCLLTHIMQEVARHDLVVELYTEHNLNRINRCLVDGVLALAWDETTLSGLKNLDGLPVVLINRPDVAGVSTVMSDHAAAARNAAEHLLAHGHRRIAFLAEEPDWGCRERLAGLRAALAEAGLEFDENLVGFNHHDACTTVLRRLLRQQPSALIVAGEDIGLEVGHLLTAELGVRLPEQLSLVGMENPRVSQYLNPPQTTVAQPFAEMAARAVGLLLKHVAAGEEWRPEKIVLECQLLRRESVARLQPDAPEASI